MTDEQLDVVTKALRRAWSLGQTYWSQADSESYSQNRRADETQLAFQRLVEDTRAALASDHALACTASNDPIAVPAAPQPEPIDPHTIDSKFSEWWQSDKADDATDNPFQPDSAAAWAYAGWMAAQSRIMAQQAGENLDDMIVDEEGLSQVVLISRAVEVWWALRLEN